MPDTWSAWSSFMAICAVVLGALGVVVKGWIDKGDTGVREHAVSLAQSATILATSALAAVRSHEEACDLRMQLLTERHEGIKQSLEHLVRLSDQRRHTDDGHRAHVPHV